MRFALLFTVLIAPAVYGQSTPEIGQVEQATEIVFYDVEGMTADELVASLIERSPSTETPKFFGVTEWEVNAEYRWVERPTGCKIEEATIRLVMRTHLPRWRPHGVADSALRDAWDDFSRNLDVHEEHHRTLILESGESLRWQLISLREPTCRTMEAATDRIVQAALSEGTARNEAYDRDTGHGRTQGAIWPPRGIR